MVVAVVVVTGCGDDSRRPEKVQSTNGDRFYVDTVLIRGNKHEILRDGTAHHYGGMMHSPECWCLKNDSVSTNQGNIPTK